MVAMVSYSLVHHRGPAEFIAQARDAGFAGAIVPDLPIEEAEELAKSCARDDFKLIQLVTPTTPRERAQRALGPRFDLRGFHHAVLRNGAIPLTLLDDEVERWTATEARA